MATRYTTEGTHEGELFGVPPTGQRLSIKSISVERVSDGKITEHALSEFRLDGVLEISALVVERHHQGRDSLA